MSPDGVLNHEEIELNLKRLPGWRYTDDALQVTITCHKAQQAIDLFAHIAQLAQDANHHPDVDWRYNSLKISLTSHDVGGKLTQRDIALAQQISQAAENFECELS